MYVGCCCAVSKMSRERKKKPDRADEEVERQKAAESDLQTTMKGILNLMQMQILDRDTRDHQFEDKLEKQRQAAEVAAKMDKGRSGCSMEGQRGDHLYYKNQGQTTQDRNTKVDREADPFTVFREF